MSKVYKQVLKFKNKYPWTVAWRLGLNSSVIEIKEDGTIIDRSIPYEEYLER